MQPGPGRGFAWLLDCYDEFVNVVLIEEPMLFYQAVYGFLSGMDSVLSGYLRASTARELWWTNH